MEFKISSEPKNVLDIIYKYLKDNCFDGLCTIDCGCGFDDLCPCEGEELQCVPAYKHINPDCSKCESKCISFDGENLSECYKTEKKD